MTEKAKALIKKYEGCRLKAYKCPAGVWTIGYGRTTNVKEGDTCTQAQADRWFEDEYKRTKNNVKKLLKVEVTPNQLGALTSFAYNVGLANLKSSTLLKYVNAKKFDLAANEFKKWVYANHRILAGLVKRRAEEKILFLT